MPSTIPQPIAVLIEKYREGTHVVPTQDVLNELNELGRELGIPGPYVYPALKQQLTARIMNRGIFIRREPVYLALTEGWRKVDLAIMNRDLTAMFNESQFETLTIEQIIDAGNSQP